MKVSFFTLAREAHNAFFRIAEGQRHISKMSNYFLEICLSCLESLEGNLKPPEMNFKREFKEFDFPDGRADLAMITDFATRRRHRGVFTKSRIMDTHGLPWTGWYKIKISLVTDCFNLRLKVKRVEQLVVFKRRFSA